MFVGCKKVIFQATYGIAPSAKKAVTFAVVLAFFVQIVVITNSIFRPKSDADRLEPLMTLPVDPETTNDFGRVKAYVITLSGILDEHSDRITTFQKRWDGFGLNYEINRGVLSDKRGLGCSMSLLESVRMAMEDGTKDFYLFLEDDAIPSASTTPDGFARQFFHTIKEWPDRSPYLLLGAYGMCHLENPPRRGNSTNGQGVVGGVTRIQVAMGSYAILMRSSFLEEFHHQLQRHVNDDLKMYSPDAFLFRKNYFDDSRPAYLASPLLVDMLPGYSATEEYVRKDPWMGNPNWWEVPLSEYWNPPCTRGTYLVRGCDLACGRVRVLIGVTASRSTFPTRVRAVESTWAGAVPPNVVVRYLVGDRTANSTAATVESGSPEDIRALAGEAGIKDPSRVVVMKGVVDDEYPLVEKAAQVLKHLHRLSSPPADDGGDFDWIMDVDDDTYVFVEAMLGFVSKLDRFEHQYVGRRAYGFSEDKASLKQAGMKHPYCNGGPGFAMSKRTLKALAGAIDSCQLDILGRVENASRIYDEVNIGICIGKIAGIGCWDGEDYDKGVFHHSFGNEISDRRLLTSVTSHPYKNPRDMVELHRRYTVAKSKERSKKK